MFVRYLEEGKAPELQLVEKVGIVGKAKILVTQVELSHRRLGEVMYAFGKGKVGESPTLVVATEDESGGKMTIRFGERG